MKIRLFWRNGYGRPGRFARMPPSYRVFCTLSKPLFSLFKAIFPRSITTTEQIGRAMLQVAKRGYPTPILESHDINSL